MPLSTLQRISAGFFSGVRGGLIRGGGWIKKRPSLAAWFYPEHEKVPAEARYREFNQRYFESFAEQEKMLADGPRMGFYHEAVARLVRPGDRVIDLGTGTGILAAFASRAGAAKTYAIDHSGILKHAQRLAQANGIANVEFVATHSKNFTTDEKVDVIIHEQMGDYLFDEAMVPNVLDLRDRLLKPGGRIVPNRFELFCEPVQVRDERRVPFIWELNIHGHDYSSLEWERPQDPGYYHQTGCDPGLVSHFLGETAPALALDLETLRAEELPREIRFTRVVVKAGRLDALAVYFRAGAGETPSLSSSPLDAGRAPHWGFRLLRLDAKPCPKGEVLNVAVSADDWTDPASWRWKVEAMP